MFYSRINKIKVFNNREGFLGLFNRKAELRIYSFAWNPSGLAGNIMESGFRNPPLYLSKLLDFDEEKRKELLVEAVLAESERFAQSETLEINGVKDNQSLFFGDTGMVIYSNKYIPNELSMQLLVVESDDDIRKFAIEADKVLDSEAFRFVCCCRNDAGCRISGSCGSGCRRRRSRQSLTAKTARKQRRPCGLLASFAQQGRTLSARYSR